MNVASKVCSKSNENRTGYIIYGAQCKMKRQGHCSKIMKNFKTATADIELSAEPFKSKGLIRTHAHEVSLTEREELMRGKGRG